jgi:Zn-dependent protease with chaperone function
MTAAALALLAVALAGPVPALLGRARFLLAVPRAAIVLWQAVAVAAILAGFGAALATVQALVLPARGDSPGRLITATGFQLILAVVLLGLTVIALVRLNAAGLRVALRLRRRRRRVRDLVDLLDRSGAEPPDGHAAAENVRVLGGPGSYAYCLPGWNSRVVLSDAALRELSPPQLAAVIAHEQAHLRARHDLLLEFFTVLHEAFPWGVRSREPLSTTRVLVELLADDAARRRHGAAPLIGALATMGAGPALEDPTIRVPERVPAGPRTRVEANTGTTELTDADVVTRIRRLIDDPPTGRRPTGSRPRPTGSGHWPTGSPHWRPGSGPRLAAAVYAVAIAVIAVPTAVLVLPWLQTTWTALATR